MTEPSDVKTDQGTDVKTDIKVDESSLGWRAALKDDLKNHDLVKGFGNPSDCVREYVKIKGESAGYIKPLTEQSTPEEKAAYFTKLGRPEKPEGYEFTKPEGLPDEMFNPKLAGDFAQFLYDKGAPKSLAQDIYKWYNQMVVDSSKTVKDQEAQQAVVEKQKTEEVLNKLKNEWVGDKFEANKAVAVEAFKKFKIEGAEELLKNAKLDGVALGDHPIFLKWFYEIGKLTKDDSALIRKEGTGINNADTEEANANKMFPSMVKKAG